MKPGGEGGEESSYELAEQLMKQGKYQVGVSDLLGGNVQGFLMNLNPDTSIPQQESQDMFVRLRGTQQQEIGKSRGGSNY